MPGIQWAARDRTIVSHDDDGYLSGLCFRVICCLDCELGSVVDGRHQGEATAASVTVSLASEKEAQDASFMEA